MAERNPPAYLGGSDYAAADDRLVLAAVFGASAPLTPMGGVVPTTTGDPLLVTHGVGMAVSVAAGQAVIPSTELGVYVVTNDAPAAQALDPADVTDPRLDRVVCRVLDADAGTAGNTWSIDVLAGDPGGVPVLPAEPVNSLTLATVRVPAGSDGSDLIITDLRPYASAIGGAGARTPRGVRALEVVPTTGTVDSITETRAGLATFTAEANRLYRIRWTPAVIDGEVGFDDGTYTAHTSAYLLLRYAIGANPTQDSFQVPMGGFRRVAVFGNDSERNDGASVTGYLTGMDEGDDVRVGAFVKAILAGYGVRAWIGVLEVEDAGPWPVT